MKYVHRYDGSTETKAEQEQLRMNPSFHPETNKIKLLLREK